MRGQQRELSFRFMAQPGDVNFGGKVHGGAVMRWIDQTGYAAAVAWSGAYCVTAAVSSIQFLQPIRIGDLVSVQAKLIHTGHSSMQFAVDVLARDLRQGQSRLTTSCVMVFVAVDAEAEHPIEVPKWTPTEPDDLKLAAYAERLSEISRSMEKPLREDHPGIIER